MEKYLNKLKYRSWHRGTKEADLFLGNFFDNNYSIMNEKELRDYEKFLVEINDNELIYIIRGEKSWPKNLQKKIIKLIEKYIRSENFRRKL